MASRFSHLFALLLAAAISISGCKTATTNPGDGDTTVNNIGDSIPRQFSNYSYSRSQLDRSDHIILGTTIPVGLPAFVDSMGLSIFGKTNVYSVRDEGDTSYFVYESNNDVSIYLKNPGFLTNHSDRDLPDETLVTIADIIFHRWITLPIASKKTGLIAYEKRDTIDISGTHPGIDLKAVVDYIGDSTITTTVTENGSIPKAASVAAKHCRITITGKLRLGSNDVTISHVRNIWFVPKLGYIALQMIRTDIPEYPILSVPLDTTAILKVMTNYEMK